MRDPIRWRDEGGGATDAEREVLASRRDVAPPKGAKDALWLALAAASPTSPASSAPAVTKTVAASTLGFKAVFFAVVVVAVGAVASIGLWKPSPPTLAVRTAVPAAAAEAPTGSVPLAPPSGTPEIEPPLAPASVASEVPRPAQASLRTEPTVTVKGTQASALSEESTLLLRVRQDLRNHDAAGALAKLDEADTRFATSALAQEREALRVEAQWQNGDRAAASTRGTIFLRSYPASPHAARIRSFISP